MLIVFGGLPGTGKTTIARVLARRLGAFHLRIDTIEQAIRMADGADGEAVDPQGYVVAYAVAGDNLRLGATVVADSVNPIGVTREAWRATALRAGVPLVEVEVVCSDPVEHRHRVETRHSDIAGHRPPSWVAVTGRTYEPWDGPAIVVDTAGRAVDACVASILAVLPIRTPDGTGRRP
ncbi:AAA family ATPase [Azospirillum brasilense]|uniref:AAA family ATPase n=1 Tax=Azospirillum brasilense TaxID=192 RepID=UPI001909AFA8|nr:AAA family ATPase [Azospirillum brasilense]MBK3737179.1 AAA family ATPase [Azospirillum brasilense]